MNHPVSHHRPWRLIICVHDVCPHWRREVEVILDALEPRVGRAVASAVIPCLDGTPWDAAADDFLAAVRARSGEILLHGFTHRRPGRIAGFSWLIEGADEFAGLPTAEAERRIECGAGILRDLFGEAPSGYVAPAFRRGLVITPMLQRHGMRYALDLAALAPCRGSNKVPLATWTWDCGRSKWLGWLGELFGNVMAMRPRAIPCIVIHPADVARGFLPRALRKIDRLQRQRYSPILPLDLLRELEAADG